MKPAVWMLAVVALLPCFMGATITMTQLTPNLGGQRGAIYAEGDWSVTPPNETFNAINLIAADFTVNPPWYAQPWPMTAGSGGGGNSGWWQGTENITGTYSFYAQFLYNSKVGPGWRIVPIYSTPPWKATVR